MAMSKEETYREQRQLYVEMYNRGKSTVEQLQARLRTVDYYYNQWIEEIEEEMKNNGEWWIDERN